MKIVYLFLASIAYSCGIAVHLELVDRITPFLPRRIAQHKDYIRSGAFYPDAFYNCHGEYDVAEDAHWPPFLANGVKMVQSRQALGLDTSRLEAFLLGILTHQISDVSWHSLGIFEGLLRAMADSEFNGDYDEAHSVLDIGGDMIFLSQYDKKERSKKSTTWDYDVDDIMDLLAINGYTKIAPASVHYCMARGQAAYSAELRVSSVAFKRSARRSPLLFHQLESYATGGLTDMHEQIQECFPRLIRWFSESKDLHSAHDPWNICPVFVTSKPSSDGQHQHALHKRASIIGHPQSKHPFLSDLKELVKDTLPEIHRKIRLHPENIASLPGKIIRKPTGEMDHWRASKLWNSNSKDPRADFGRSVTFWNSRIVVGAPGEGRVYIFDENLNSIDRINSTVSQLKEFGHWPAHFGAQVGIWANYLVVSSPGLSQIDIYNEAYNWIGGIKWPQNTSKYGTRGLKMVGETMEVDESDNTLYIGAPRADRPVDCTKLSTNDEWIDQAGYVYALRYEILQSLIVNPHYIELNIDDHVLHQGSVAYDLVGSSISVSPRFVLVGVPGQSQVLGFDFATQKQILTLRDKRESQLSGFGQFLLGGNKDMLFVGAPSAGSNQNGELLIYKNNRGRRLSADGDFSWFGQNGVNIGDRLIVASSHANSGNGMLWEVDLFSGTKTTLGSDRALFGTQFGASMKTNGSIVVIGMPYYSNPSHPDTMGGIYVMDV